MKRYSRKLGEDVEILFTDYDQNLSFITGLVSGESAIVNPDEDLRPERCGPEITHGADKFFVECFCGDMRRESYSTAIMATQAWATHVGKRVQIG